VKYIFGQAGLVILLACGTILSCSPAAAAQDAASNYKSKCVVCHGADGKGSAMGQKLGTHDFSSPDVQKETDAQLTEILTKGKGKMPAYGGKLSDSAIKDLVDYIRTLGKK